MSRKITNKNTKMNNNIFISIASYRDTELIPTLVDMITRAKHPEHLSFSVCWQDDTDISMFTAAGFTLTETTQLDNAPVYRYCYQQSDIRIISIHYLQSKGACWARAMCEKLYQNEYYFLQIDSHSRVIDSWDEMMKADLENLMAHTPLAIISTYPPAYLPSDDDESFRTSNIHDIKIHFTQFDQKKIPCQVGRACKNEMMLPTPFWAAGYAFTLGRFVTDVGNDPDLFFHGEEIAMAVRAFTHGYNIFHPNNTLIWHCYQRTNAPRIWSDHTQESVAQGKVKQAWWQYDAVSKQRVRKLLGIDLDSDIELGRYGLGTARTLRQYQYYSGLSFSDCKVHAETINHESKYTYTTVVNDHQQWCEQLSEHHYKKVRVKRSEVIQPTQQNLFAIYDRINSQDNAANNNLNTDAQPEKISITVFDEKKRLLHKLSLNYQTLNQKFPEDDFAFEVYFQNKTNQSPTLLTLCPWYKEIGWGKTTELTW